MVWKGLIRINSCKFQVKFWRRPLNKVFNLIFRSCFIDVAHFFCGTNGKMAMAWYYTCSGIFRHYGYVFIYIWNYILLNKISTRRRKPPEEWYSNRVWRTTTSILKMMFSLKKLFCQNLFIFQILFYFLF